MAESVKLRKIIKSIESMAHIDTKNASTLRAFTMDLSTALGSKTALPDDTVLQHLKDAAMDMAHSLSQGSLDLTQIIPRAHGIISIVHCFTEDSIKINHFSSDLIEITSLLHDSLFQIDEPVLSQLQNDLCQLCETFWAFNSNGREFLVCNSFLFLTVFCLQDSAKPKDFKRLYDFREALLVMDVESADSDTLKFLLLRCVSSPSMLSSAYGRRFVGFLFEIDDNLMASVHEAVKSKLATSTSSETKLYASIYVDTWKRMFRAKSKRISVFEDHCIQNLMFASVHLKDIRLADTVRRFLHSLHYERFTASKPSIKFEGMIQRLYEPILWRSLQASNPSVRLNASKVFLDAFPVQDPSQSNAFNDDMMQRQLKLMEELLFDPFAEIRAWTAKHLCVALAKYNEVFPVVILKRILKKLSQLCFDASGSGSKVRFHALKGFQTLLSNHALHPMLGEILPSLGHMICDRSERVRKSFIDLLEKIKGVKSIKCFDIVTFDDLMDALVLSQSNTLKRKIVRLVYPSVIPIDVTFDEQLKSALQFLNRDIEAAVEFFKILPHVLPPALVCKFVFSVVKAMEISSHVSQEENTAPRRKSKKKAKHVNSGSLKQMHWEMMFSLCTHMWFAVAPKLDSCNDKPLLEFVGTILQDGIFDSILETVKHSPSGLSALFAFASAFPNCENVALLSAAQHCDSKAASLYLCSVSDGESILKRVIDGLDGKKRRQCFEKLEYFLNDSRAMVNFDSEVVMQSVHKVTAVLKKSLIDGVTVKEKYFNPIQSLGMLLRVSLYTSKTLDGSVKDIFDTFTRCSDKRVLKTLVSVAKDAVLSGIGSEYLLDSFLSPLSESSTTDCEIALETVKIAYAMLDRGIWTTVLVDTTGNCLALLEGDQSAAPVVRKCVFKLCDGVRDHVVDQQNVISALMRLAVSELSDGSSSKFDIVAKALLKHMVVLHGLAGFFERSSLSVLEESSEAYAKLCVVVMQQVALKKGRDQVYQMVAALESVCRIIRPLVSDSKELDSALESIRSIRC